MALWGPALSIIQYIGNYRLLQIHRYWMLFFGSNRDARQHPICSCTDLSHQWVWFPLEKARKISSHVHVGSISSHLENIDRWQMLTKVVCGQSEALLHSTMALPDSTTPYNSSTCVPNSTMARLDSTLVYYILHGSTWFYFTSLYYILPWFFSTLLDSITLYNSSTWLSYTLLCLYSPTLPRFYFTLWSRVKPW